MADYSFWSSLTDRSWFSRYLPPKGMSGLPPVEALPDLYTVRSGDPRVSTRSTLLFPSLAQWFSDGFLMASSLGGRRTTTNHQIDLSQIYGLTTAVQKALRQNSEKRGCKAGCFR